MRGLRPAQAPELAITAGVAWRPWQSGQFSADARYESARFDDDLNTRELDAALSLDLRFEQNISDNAALFIALDNALDTAIETGATADGVTLYAAPRALRVGFRVAG